MEFFLNRRQQRYRRLATASLPLFSLLPPAHFLRESLIQLVDLMNHPLLRKSLSHQFPPLRAHPNRERPVLQQSNDRLRDVRGVLDARMKYRLSIEAHFACPIDVEGDDLLVV